MSTPETEMRPKVGIGVMILKEGKVLLGKRKNALGGGDYAFPGGHLEHLESFEECAIRETREEAGIEIKNLEVKVLANVLTYKPKHYVQVGIIAEWASGDVRNMEPDKLEGWDWYALDALPAPLMRVSALAIEAYQTGKWYFGTIE